MKKIPALLAAMLLPAQAVAGSQYTAEDIIRYFEQANANVRPLSPSVARTAPAADRGIALGDPARTRGATVGDAPAATSSGVVVGGVPASGPVPFAIPMTGAKAGLVVPPAQGAAAATAAPADRGGYDMLVTFEVNSATLTPQAQQNLEIFAQALRSPALAGVRFAVEGHTDATGSAEHNLTLSKARAASVVSYLVTRGVEPARLTAAGYGEARPRVADAEHADNRRVETRRLD